MTMIAGLIINNINGFNVDRMFIAGDSRVIRPSGQSEKFKSRFDSAQKVVQLTPNVVIGLAGDYRFIQTFKKLEKSINKLTLDRKPYYNQSSGILANIISQHLKSYGKENNYDETDFIYAICDFKTKKKRLYHFFYPLENLTPINEGLHLIGCDKDTRDIFMTKYHELRGKQITYNLNPQDTSLVTPLLGSFAELGCFEVGGTIICYEINNNTCIPIGSAIGFISEETKINLISNGYQENDNSWHRQVNGKEISKTTTDYSHINEKLEKELKSD